MNCAEAIYYLPFSLYSIQYAAFAAIVAISPTSQLIWLREWYKLPKKEKIMSKGQDSKKNVKKKPLLTAKEKKAAKQSKKEDSGSILGKH